MELTVFIIILIFAGALAMELLRIRKGSRSIIPAAIMGICGVAILAIILAPADALLESNPTVFKPSSYKGKMGKISIAYKGQFILVAKNKKSSKTWQFSASKGVIQAPVGAYDLISYEAIAKDKQKAQWSAFSTSLNRSVTVKADAVQNLKIGPPYTASIAVTPNGRSEITLDFKLVGSGNEPSTILKNTGTGNPPGFKVIDSSGKVLWQGSFKYG